MEEAKKSSYNGYTDARKEANKRYMENFVEIKVRTTPKHRETIKTHASSTDESVNSFIIRAIDETMKRDNQNAEPQYGRNFSLTPESDNRHIKPELTPNTPVHETLDAKLERLSKEHMAQ